MKNYPKISIIIVSLNAERTLKKCLSYIKAQTYPSIDEIVLVDGGSIDNTLKIARTSKMPVRIIHAGYKDNQEARRSIGIVRARNDLCAFIDTDNYVTDTTWIADMVEPLIKDQKIIASQTLRYDAPHDDTSVFNRYFGLLGAGDPVAYYLGKADRLSWMHDRWNLLGTIIAENKRYYTIEFDPQDYPTVGANGIVFRKSILTKAKWGSHENYFHTDVFVDIGKLGYNRFAIVKNTIFHDTAETLSRFFKKRKTYMELHNQNLSHKRRYFIFNPKKISDIIKLLLFIIFSLTFIVPILESIRGFMKKKDPAWFLHPLVCLGITYIYSLTTLKYLCNKLIKNI